MLGYNASRFITLRRSGAAQSSERPTARIERHRVPLHQPQPQQQQPFSVTWGDIISFISTVLTISLTVTAAVSCMHGAHARGELNVGGVLCDIQNLVCALSSTISPISCAPVTCDLFRNTWSRSSPASSKNLRVNMRDYALNWNGGRIEHGLTSPTFDAPTLSLWGRWLAHARGWTPRHARLVIPESVIDEDLRVGKCWSFSGPKGHVGIILSEYVNITHVSLYSPHHDELSPIQLQQSPRKISIWVFLEPGYDIPSNARATVPAVSFRTLDLVHLDSRVLSAGTFLLVGGIDYDPTRGTRQTFDVGAHQVTTSVVVLEIHENGGSNRTCLYRTSVHGLAQG
ncbi:Protein kinase protein rad53 [Paramarasmius palmivorus]|uniref:Protein kinase protein rad53 n=1 Tax=Paramarasmius palmivorus TaxID=297713 RepID=A0AAW0BI11_9AGAR